MILAFSQKYGGFRCTAHTDQRGKGRNGKNDRCGHANSGEGLQDAYDLGIAVIYQELSNIPCLSVVENMYLGFEKRKGGLIDWKEQKRCAKKALERVGLADIDVDMPMEKLGMGQRQLVEIARAIDRNAKLLIMDEPTSSLSRKELEYLLKLM